MKYILVYDLILDEYFQYLGDPPDYPLHCSNTQISDIPLESSHLSPERKAREKLAMANGTLIKNPTPKVIIGINHR